MDTNSHCKAHRTTSTSRRHGPDTCQLRRLQRPRCRRVTSICETVKEALRRVHARCRRTSIPDGQAYQSTRTHSRRGRKGRMLENPQAGQPIDPSKLEFCKVLYDFTPNANMQGMDLTVKKGDLVAILSKTDPMGNASEWWRCRSREGGMGYLPGIYLEPIQRKPQAQITSGSPASSRAQTLTSTSFGSRTGTMTEKTAPALAPKVESKAGDIGVESFQKGAFYS